MSLHHTCTSCGHTMTIADHYGGRELFCTACSAPFTAEPAQTGTAASHCPGCGAAISADSRYCSGCGGAVSAAGLAAIPRPTVVTVLAVLQLLGGGLYALGALVFLGVGIAKGEGSSLVVGVVCALLAGLGLALGLGLWRLRPWARLLMIGLSVIGLLGFPLGTLISALILVYLFSAPAKVAFSGRSPSELTPAQAALVTRSASGAAVAAVVVVAVLVVVMFVGIIAAIAIPNLLNAVNRGRVKRSVADMQTITLAIEDYQQRNGSAPAGVENVEELIAALASVEPLPRNDGWNHPFEFRSSADGSSWELVCLGRDGLGGSRPGGEVSNFNDDLVLLQDGWYQWPIGLELQ